MKRLTTDTPQDNIETALNLFYIKDRETWVRGGGPGPEYKDISLYDFARMVTKALIPEVELPTDNDNLSMMMGEWMLDDPDTEEGVISLLYTAAWAYAEIRHRLKAYEDTGLTPEICANYKMFEDEAISKGVTFGRIVELMNAEADGKLVVPPCKVGDTVYTRNHHGRIVDGKVQSIHQNYVAGKAGRWVVTAYYPEYNGTAESGLHPDFLSMTMYYGFDDVGKTVLRTSEEAEKALAEVRDHA